ncbi:MAG: HEAT repeat domain-containing protein [Planctomycetota bacterium]
MAFLLTLLLLAPDPAATRVPQVIRHLEARKTAEALSLLKEIGRLKQDHAEAKALVRMVRNRRIKKPPEILAACFHALYGIGSRKVTRSLLALLEHSTLKKDPAIRIGVCRALEGSADPAGVASLIDLMRDREDRVIAAAAAAAGAYRYEKETVRKELFNAMLNIYEATWNLKNSVKPELKKEKRRAERKWEVVNKPMEKSLQLLSNVTQDDPPLWRRWWNKNKRKRWANLEH